MPMDQTDKAMLRLSASGDQVKASCNAALAMISRDDLTAACDSLRVLAESIADNGNKLASTVIQMGIFLATNMKAQQMYEEYKKTRDGLGECEDE